VRLAELIVAEHRRIEEELDRLAESLRRGEPETALEWFTAAWRAASAHFAVEERILFAAVQPGFAKLIARMEDQHAQVREAAVAFQAAAESGSGDFLLLGRRFHALLAHHLIEEERDLVALLERFLAPALEAELVEALERGGARHPDSQG